MRRRACDLGALDTQNRRLCLATARPPPVHAGIPIAMPTVLSVTLALGAFTLAKEGAIVSRMSGTRGGSHARARAGCHVRPPAGRWLSTSARRLADVCLPVPSPPYSTCSRGGDGGHGHPLLRQDRCVLDTLRLLGGLRRLLPSHRVHLHCLNPCARPLLDLPSPSPAGTLTLNKLTVDHVNCYPLSGHSIEEARRSAAVPPSLRCLRCLRLCCTPLCARVAAASAQQAT